MIEWWAELSPWVRYGVAVFFMLLSTVLLLVFDLFWPWGWGAGVIFLFFAGPSDSEKRGYRF